MGKQDSSHTALVTAYLRAAHQIIDSGPRVLDDPIALHLLGPKAEERIRGRNVKFMSDKAKALRAHVMLRSRYAEDQLKLSMARGTSQYILLGAGFDTFAFRQPPWAAGLRIFEVDHSGTQREKQSRIFNAGITVPKNLIFVKIDFEKESLEDRLAAADVRKDEPTFFSWLGVTMYLTEEAVDSTLRYMAGFARGSEAVITFLQPPDGSTSSHELAERVAEAGESFISRFTPERFEEKLRAAGFHKVCFLTHDLSAPYFPENGSSLSNPRRTSIVSALVL